MNGDPAIRYRPTTLILAMLVAAFAVAEVPRRTPEQLEAMATDIVLGVVESRVIEESKDERFLRRGFTFQVRVEETLKGELARGATIPVTAWTSTWIGEGRPPAGATGHRPLPLEGELARFFLVAKTNAEGTTRYGIVLPNGVELGGGADATDPVRRGDAARVVASPPAEESAPTKDPFGWDVVLVLLALPIVIGSLRQNGKARWILLGVGSVLLAGAAAVVLL